MTTFFDGDCSVYKILNLGNMTNKKDVLCNTGKKGKELVNIMEMLFVQHANTFVNDKEV